jgi:hypothetical protein
LKDYVKHLAWLLTAATLHVSSFASDKDILRDACTSLKPAAKKSACFDALDRISAPAPAAAPVVQKPVQSPDRKLKFSLRGMQCEAIEFPELDSMPADELEGLYCSYDLGIKTSEKLSKQFQEKNEGNPRVQVALLERHVAELERCGREMTKAGDVFRRKWPEMKTDCSKLLKKKTEDSAPQEGAPSPAPKSLFQ